MDSKAILNHKSGLSFSWNVEVLLWFFEMSRATRDLIFPVANSSPHRRDWFTKESSANHPESLVDCMDMSMQIVSPLRTLDFSHQSSIE
jgi:hypothetical protein